MSIANERTPLLQATPDLRWKNAWENLFAQNPHINLFSIEDDYEKKMRQICTTFERRLLSANKLKEFNRNHEYNLEDPDQVANKISQLFDIVISIRPARQPNAIEKITRKIFNTDPIYKSQRRSLRLYTPILIEIAVAIPALVIVISLSLTGPLGFALSVLGAVLLLIALYHATKRYDGLMHKQMKEIQSDYINTTQQIDALRERILLARHANEILRNTAPAA